MEWNYKRYLMITSFSWEKHILCGYINDNIYLWSKYNKYYMIPQEKLAARALIYNISPAEDGDDFESISLNGWSFFRDISFHVVPWDLSKMNQPWYMDGRHINRLWWRHQMETFSALLALCVGNSPVTGEFHAQRPVTQNFDTFFDLRLNKRMSKQWRGWWFETPSRPLWRHYNTIMIQLIDAFLGHI